MYLFSLFGFGSWRSFEEFWTDHKDYSCACSSCKQQWRFDLPGNHPGHSWEIHLKEQSTTTRPFWSSYWSGKRYHMIHMCGNKLFYPQGFTGSPKGRTPRTQHDKCQAFFHGEDLHPLYLIYLDLYIYICKRIKKISHPCQAITLQSHHI